MWQCYCSRVWANPLCSVHIFYTTVNKEVKSLACTAFSAAFPYVQTCQGFQFFALTSVGVYNHHLWEGWMPEAQPMLRVEPKAIVIFSDRHPWHAFYCSGVNASGSRCSLHWGWEWFIEVYEYILEYGVGLLRYVWEHAGQYSFMTKIGMHKHKWSHRIYLKVYEIYHNYRSFWLISLSLHRQKGNWRYSSSFQLDHMTGGHSSKKLCILMLGNRGGSNSNSKPQTLTEGSLVFQHQNYNFYSSVPFCIGKRIFYIFKIYFYCILNHNQCCGTHL